MTHDINSPEFWNEQYDNGRIPWDLGRPTPVFRRLLEEGTLTPGRMIVLGAGRGHDARMFARHGFDVTAVDFAANAVAAMRAAGNDDASLTILHSDLFDLPPDFAGQFDYVLEYTCFCAIDPARRPEYADTVVALLRPHGRYVALAFPIGTRPGGPPFVVQPQGIVVMFQQRGLTLERREWPEDSVPARKGVEQLLILRKDA